MGSKNKYANELLPIILKSRLPNQWYVEPFVGGFNMIDKVIGNRIANDTNYYLIELFKAVQNGWLPPTNISEEEYKNIRTNKDLYPPYLVGFVGFGCSYSGKWFGGYARGNTNNGVSRNYCDESRRNLLKQARKIKDVIIYNKNYLKLEIPKNSIIYCDPPYADTTSYKDNFNHDLFWNWVRSMDMQEHKVYISEYKAPEDFICIWSKKVNNTLVKETGSKQGVERLFINKEHNHE